MTKENLELLRTSKLDKKQIDGSVNYEILNEQYYKKRFDYKPLNERYDVLDFELCNVVIEALNLTGKCMSEVLTKQDNKRMSEFV